MIDPGFADHPDVMRGTFDFAAYSAAGVRTNYTVEVKTGTVRYKAHHNELDWVWRTDHVHCIKGRAML